MSYRHHIKYCQAVFSFVCMGVHTQAHTHKCVCVVAVSLLSHVQLFGDPMNCSPSGSSPVLGSPIQNYWSGLPFPSLGDLSHPGIKLVSPALADGFCTTQPACTCVSVLKLIITLPSLLGVYPLWEPLAWLSPRYRMDS